MFPEQKPHSEPPSSEGLIRFAEIYRVNLFAAFMMVVLDMMVFSAFEASSFELLAFVSAIVGMMFWIPCAILQRYGNRDPWLVSLAKGWLLSLLVSLPTPIPSGMIFGWALLTVLANKQDRERERDVIDTEGEEVVDDDRRDTSDGGPRKAA